MSTNRGKGMVWDAINGDRGFTILEVMIAIVLLTFGLLAVADVIPQGLALGLYGKDQTKSSVLAQQEIECLKYQTTLTLQGMAQDYAVNRASLPTACNPSSSWAMTTYFTQDGVSTTSTSPTLYFTRDVQIQYWTWNGTQFVASGTPYTLPTSGYYVFRVSVATHWLARGQTIFQSGQIAPNKNGCAIGQTAYTVGKGCVTASTFISP